MENNLFSVSGLNEYVSGLIAADPFLGDVRVRGEISGFKRHTSGHLYFSLKDEQSLVRCVMFRQQAMRLSFRPEDGMQVVLSGYASLYQRDGSFQLYAKSLEKQGQGELFAKFTELKAALEEAGLFDPARKRAIPTLPKCVGVVTSGTGAALQDILNIIYRRYPRMNVCVCAVKVQGEGAAREIAAGIRRMNAESDADVLIVGRGGGSIEDLWAFNEPVVASAIFESRIPVISAVGHETDFTIADFVADLRAPTPSAAAELAVPEYDIYEETVRALCERMARAQKNDLLQRRSLLERRRLSAGFTLPERRLDEARARLEQLSLKLAACPQERLTGFRTALSRQTDRLMALGPESALRRGFAFITDASGKPKTSVKELSAGANLTAHLCDGRLFATVTAVETNGEESYGKETHI